jgi:8-oxo-dGTP diphosphatase
MQVIAQWTGGQADTLRQALRMTIEAFAERLEMSPRAVAYWRSHPEIVPRSHVQRALDLMLERASDRVKAQFALLIGETYSVQSGNGTESSNEPFEPEFGHFVSA